MKKTIFKVFPTLIFSSLILSSGTFAFTANEKNEEDVNITFMANGGKFSDDLSYKTKQFPYGCTWSSIKDNLIPKPTYSGYDLTKWTFDQAGTNAVGDTYTFTSDITIYAQWGANDPGTFASDSWATIINVADNGYTTGGTTYYGLEALKKAYVNDIGEYNNTFVIQNMDNEAEVVKKTRTVTLDGFGTFNVRVIGENHDLIAGSEDKVAALTFEFSNLVFPGVNYAMSAEEGKCADYLTSNLKSKLDNELLMIMPDVLKANMQTVTKKVLKSGSSNEIVTFDDKLFALSSSEIGYTETNTVVSKKTIAPLEGSVYPFYHYNNSNSARIKKYNDTYEEGGKTISRSTAVDYWLRSFKLNSDVEDPTAYYIVSSYGSASNEKIIDLKGVAPCFCIGKALTSSNIRNVSYSEDTPIGQTMLHSDSYVGNGTEYIGTIKFTTDYSTYKVGSLTITVGDHELEDGTGESGEKEFSYDADTGLVTIPSYVLDDYSGDITIQGNIIKDGFKIDTWERFLKNVAKGYDYLKDTSWDETSDTCGYKEIYEANGNTFVGLTRPVEVQRYKFDSSEETVTDTYLVRIIGELTDTFKNAEDNLRSSTFTFEFTESMRNEDIDWNNDTTLNNYYYTTSNLKTRLDDFPDRFLNDSANLKDNLKSVTKKVYYKTGSKADPAIKEETFKMFPLSANELGYPLSGVSDGEAYQYYEDGDLLKTVKVSNNNRVVAEKTPLRGKVYTKSDYNYYWTRTPDLDNEGTLTEDPPRLGKVYVFGSQEDSGTVYAQMNERYANYMQYQFDSDYNTDCEAISYAPAFCVGDEAPRFKVNTSIRGYNFTGGSQATYGTTYTGTITSKSVEVDGTTYTPNAIPDASNGEITVTIAGEDKTSSCYTKTSETEGTISIPGDLITGKVAITINDVPLNLSWAGLNALATYDEDNSKQGEFVKEYIHDGGYLPFVDNDGVTRNIKVIGYGHDPLKSNISKKAALTMEFDDVLSVPDSESKATKWMTTFDKSGSTTGSGAVDFTNSGVNSVINTYYSTMIPETGEYALKDYIKEVKKDYTKYNSSTLAWDYTQYNAKMFPLSYNEYNLSIWQYGEYFVERGYLLDNSSAYDYYAGTTKLSTTLNNKRSKSYSYHLRTAINMIDSGRYYSCFACGKEDALAEYNMAGQGLFTNFYFYKYSDPLSICPAFCI